MKVTLEDGTEKDVPTEEELKALNEKAEKAGELSTQIEKFKTDLGVGEGESLEDKLQEMKDSMDPNWPAARKKMKNLEKAVKEEGKEVDEGGNIIQKKEISEEDITNKINDGVNAKFLEKEKDRALSKFSVEDRKTIEPFLDKLIKIDGRLDENIPIAVGMAFPEEKPDSIKEVMSSSGGAGPIVEGTGKKKNYADTEEGKATANVLGISIEKKEENK